MQRTIGRTHQLVSADPTYLRRWCSQCIVTFVAQQIMSNSPSTIDLYLSLAAGQPLYHSTKSPYDVWQKLFLLSSRIVGVFYPARLLVLFFITNGDMKGCITHCQPWYRFKHAVRSVEHIYQREIVPYMSHNGTDTHSAWPKDLITPVAPYLEDAFLLNKFTEEVAHACNLTSSHHVQYPFIGLQDFADIRKADGILIFAVVNHASLVLLSFI